MRCLVVLVVAALASTPALAAQGSAPLPWWAWTIALFVACFLIGIVAVPAGIGGGTLFVPIIGSFFPFHVDFVRGAGLLVALASATAAGPTLLESGLGSLRLALPLAVLASLSSIAGAAIGLAMPAQMVQLLLGLLVLAIVVPMAFGPRSQGPVRMGSDALAQALGLGGRFVERASGQVVHWRVHRTATGMVLFLMIGLLGGMFGIGAGWANVPVLNLVMAAPLKVAAGTSGLVLSLASSSAAWIYLDQGAVLPAIAVPAIAGVMLGARVGARLLEALEINTVRRIVTVLLLFAGGRALLSGLGVWA